MQVHYGHPSGDWACFAANERRVRFDHQPVQGNLLHQFAQVHLATLIGGICANDDCGQTSAWYVFSALGFYPVDPASGVYALGSPLVDKVTLKLDSKFAKGRSFTVIAKINSAKHPFTSQPRSTASRSRATGFRTTKSAAAANWCW